MATILTNRATLGVVTTINQSFGWMFVGLLVTTIASLLITSSQTLTNTIINNDFVYFGLIIAELIVVFVLSAKIQSMTFSEAVGTFLLYSFLNGLTLSSIFVVYTTTSIVATFLVSAVVFGI